MAKVPVYQQRVQESASPRVRFTPDATPSAFGGAQAQGISQLAQGLGAVTDALRESEFNRDKALVRDELNNVRSEARTFMADVYSRKGKDAINVYPEVQKQLDEYKKARLKKLTTPQQQEMFNTNYYTLMNGHLDRAIAFQEDARKKFEIETLQAENENAINDAVSARTDKKEILKAELEIEANTRQANKGQSADIIKNSVSEAVHNLHATVLEALAQDSPKAAAGYLAENKDKFDPKYAARTEAQLREKVKEIDIRDTAIAISSTGTLEEQLSRVDKIADMDKATKVRRLVKERYNEKVNIQKAQAKQRIDSEADKIYKNPFGYRLNVSEFSASEQDYLYNLQQRIKNDKIAEQGGGSKSRTQPDVYMDLMTMPVDDLRKQDLKKYVNKLSSSDFEEIFKRQRDGDKYTNQMTTLKTAISGMDDFKIPSGRRSNSGKAKEAALRKTRLIAAFQNRLNNVPVDQQTPDKINDIIYKELLAPVDPGIFSGEIYRFEIPYLEDKKKDKYIRSILPESIDFDPDNVEYDERKNVFYVYGDGIRAVYDRDGVLIKRQRRID